MSQLAKSYLPLLLMLSAPLAFPVHLEASTIKIDACENTALWQSQGAPHSKVDIRAVAEEAKQDDRCIRLAYNWRKAFAWFRPPIAWGDHDALTFWLRIDRGKQYQWQLRVSAESEDEVFTIWREIDLDFDGWAQVRLTKHDVQSYVMNDEKRMDWSKIRQFAFGLEDGIAGSRRPHVYIDDIRYEKTDVLKAPDAPNRVPIISCDSVQGWRSTGVELTAVPAYKVEGRAALQIHYRGVTTGQASAEVGRLAIGPHHALAMALRGPGVTTKAHLAAELITDNGGRFTKFLDIVNFEMRQQLFFPGEFRRTPGPDGTEPQWHDVTEIRFVIQNHDPRDSGNIIIDDIRFERMEPPRKQRSVDDRFWWWDGGFDPFAAMHVIHADWPHLQSDERPALLKFSQFLLSPLVPYTIYLHNDGNSARFRVTITDWQTNVQKVLDIDSPQAGVVSHQLVAPPRCGTYIFNVACLDQEGNIAKTYQTGITVLAKRLREPKGIWGLHGYIGSKGSHWPHHRQVLRMLQATGVMILRERTPYVLRSATEQIQARRGPQGRVLELARQMGISTVVSAHMGSSAHLWGNGRYDYGGIIPGQEQEVYDTMVSLVETFRGLVDWWEIGNEPNEHPLAPYAKILSTCYRAVKQTDPQAKVVMGGSHVIDRWQYQAWELERDTGIPHQDALATHLYPEPSVLESTLRSWIAQQGSALVDKGMLMTEAGWPTFPAKTIALHQQGLLRDGYSGERISQDWYIRYAPILLGEHMQREAALHGVCFFRSTPSMGEWMFKQSPGEIRVNSKGHFAARWNDREITMGRPMAYTHNTIARLLTHEVDLAKVSVDYDHTQGKVEHYAFKRPGEYIVTLWIGVHAGSRANQMTARVHVPPTVGLVLTCDMDGNEQVLSHGKDHLEVKLLRDQAQYLRLLEGTRHNGVFVKLQGFDHHAANGADSCHLVTRVSADPELRRHYESLAAAGISHGPQEIDGKVNIFIGTASSESAIAIKTSWDRNLPTISDLVPRPGQAMILFSPAQRTVFLVGQSNADLTHTVPIFIHTMTNI